MSRTIKNFSETLSDKEKAEKFDKIERIMRRYLPGGTLYLPTGKELVLAKVAIAIKKGLGYPPPPNLQMILPIPNLLRLQKTVFAFFL